MYTENVQTLTQSAIFRRSRENKRVSDDLDVVHMKVSEAVQQFDHRFAVQLKGNATDEPAEQLEHALDNDRTNACAFLSVKIADFVLRG